MLDLKETGCSLKTLDTLNNTTMAIEFIKIVMTVVISFKH